MNQNIKPLILATSALLASCEKNEITEITQIPNNCSCDTVVAADSAYTLVMEAKNLVLDVAPGGNDFIVKLPDEVLSLSDGSVFLDSMVINQNGEMSFETSASLGAEYYTMEYDIATDFFQVNTYTFGDNGGCYTSNSNIIDWIWHEDQQDWDEVMLSDTLRIRKFNANGEMLKYIKVHFPLHEYNTTPGVFTEMRGYILDLTNFPGSYPHDTYPSVSNPGTALSGWSEPWTETMPRMEQVLFTDLPTKQFRLQ